MWLTVFYFYRAAESERTSSQLIQVSSLLEIKPGALDSREAILL